MEERVPTVYLVDDDPDVLTAIGRLIESEGLQVAAFASAQRFLDGFDRRAPGCLVLDLAMPGINGLELQRSLEQEGSLLPIIFLTGRGDIATSVQAMKHGAVDFLTKPVADTALRRRARRRQQGPPPCRQGAHCASPGLAPPGRQVWRSTARAG
jgi:FixJ family two-component response regulator